MIEISINTEVQNDLLYKQLDASFGADALLYHTLSEKIQLAGISEASLMKWARYVKLAPDSAITINELEEFAVTKILRSWKSIQGLVNEI